MAKDYTKIKHSDLIESAGQFMDKEGKMYRKKGHIVEQGPPGTLSKVHDRAMVKLNKIMAAKRKKSLDQGKGVLTMAAGGGRIGKATHGYGKAYMKGGRVK